MTAATLSAVATYTAIAGAVVSAAGAVYGGVSSYQAGKAERSAKNQAARAAQQQAEAQAQEQERQARDENMRAGVEQIKGEQEAEKRSRMLANDMGSTYANFAGNGLLVDGSGKDSLGAALTTQATEGAFDISTIKDNAAMNVWTHKSNSNSMLASAGNTRIAGKNQANMYRYEGKIAAMKGRSELIGSSLGAAGGLMKSVGGKVQ